jgi:hypothetical protein
LKRRQEKKRKEKKRKEKKRKEGKGTGKRFNAEEEKRRRRGHGEFARWEQAGVQRMISLCGYRR